MVTQKYWTESQSKNRRFKYKEKKETPVQYVAKSVLCKSTNRQAKIGI